MIMKKYVILILALCVMGVSARGQIYNPPTASNITGLGPFATNTNIAITNVTGLQPALDGKLATNGMLAVSNVSNFSQGVTNALPAWSATTNPATVRTNLGLGANDSVTFAGITNTGDAVMGAAVANTFRTYAGTFEAPNATATNANSVMTRNLVDMEPLYSIGQVFRGGPLSYGSANGGSASARDLDRLAMALSSTNAASYGRISIQRGLTTVSALNGEGINFSKTLAISTRVAVSFDNTNAVVRLVVGANGGTPSMADAAPLAAVGFGWEASRATLGLAKFRAFAHDGTNITYSGWTTGQYNDLYPLAVVISSSGGTVTLQVAPVLSRTFETVTTTGGPTTMGAYANSFVDLYAASPTATGEVAQVALMDAIFSTK